MAGARGNQAKLGLAKQTVKGTPIATPTQTYLFTGGNIQPSRTVEQLSETDATRNEGESYASQTAIEGAPEVYVRDSNIHTLLTAALGTQADTGSVNFTHTITPAAALPYYTLTRSLGGLLFEQFEDCMVSELVISADAGSPLTAAATVVGRKSTRTVAEPTYPAQPTDAVYTFNDATVTVRGAATSLVSSFELTITNNVTPQQTDDAIPYDLTPGVFSVAIGFDMIFESLTEYNWFNYGSAAGTAQSPVLNTVDLDFTFGHGVNNSVQFTLPKAAYEEFPVEPDAGGDPIVVSARARAQRSPSPFLTAIVKNQVAT